MCGRLWLHSPLWFRSESLWVWWHTMWSTCLMTQHTTHCGYRTPELDSSHVQPRLPLRFCVLEGVKKSSVLVIFVASKKTNASISFSEIRLQWHQERKTPETGTQRRLVGKEASVNGKTRIDGARKNKKGRGKTGIKAG